MTLTERQQRELEYHRARAAEHEKLLSEPIAYNILKGDRWWNNGWAMYRVLNRLALEGKRVLVVGCGFGTDAIRIAKFGAEVFAFDLSPESIAIAKELAIREHVCVTFDEMTAESLKYPAGFFDVIVARDILHHVEIPRSMAEMRRVARSGAVVVINEVYSHSWTDRIRHSWLVERLLYSRLKSAIYADDVYITQDERKLTEHDLDMITTFLSVERREYFNLLVMRVLPDGNRRVAQLDQFGLKLLCGLGRYVAGRVLLVGVLRSNANHTR